VIALHSDADADGRPRVLTTVGRPPGRPPAESSRRRVESPIARKARLTAIRLRLMYGPFLAAFDAGMYQVRDIAGQADRAHLMQIDDDELVDAIDRDREMRRTVE